MDSPHNMPPSGTRGMRWKMAPVIMAEASESASSDVPKALGLAFVKTNQGVKTPGLRGSSAKQCWHHSGSGAVKRLDVHFNDALETLRWVESYVPVPGVLQSREVGLPLWSQSICLWYTQIPCIKRLQRGGHKLPRVWALGDRGGARQVSCLPQQRFEFL